MLWTSCKYRPIRKVKDNSGYSKKWERNFSLFSPTVSSTFETSIFAVAPQKNESITRLNGTAANSKMAALWAIDLSPSSATRKKRRDLNKLGDMHFSDMMTMRNTAPSPNAVPKQT